MKKFNKTIVYCGLYLAASFTTILAMEEYDPYSGRVKNGSLSGKNIISVPLDGLKPNADWQNKKLDNNKLIELSKAKDGLQIPPISIEYGLYGINVINGNHRVAYSKSQGQEWIKAECKAISLHDQISKETVERNGLQSERLDLFKNKAGDNSVRKSLFPETIKKYEGGGILQNAGNQMFVHGEGLVFDKKGLIDNKATDWSNIHLDFNKR